MKTSLCLFLLLFSFFLHAQDNVSTINEVFTSYQAAVVNDKGIEAAQYLDSHSIAYFNKILENVRSADSVALESLSLPEKFNVLMVRHLSTKKEIMALTPQKLAAFNYTHGWGGKDDLQDATLGKVKIKNNTATAPLVKDGKKTDTTYTFYLEGSEWKIDITPFVHEGEKDFQDMLQGKSENEFIFGMLELMSGKTPSRSIWKKVI